jgi:quercetin dioxygenase-like cupin family protein
VGVIVIRDQDQSWQDVSDAWAGKAKADEPGLAYKVLLPHQPGRPNMQRTRYEPRHFEPPHTHPEDEVIYLLAGEIAFGDQTLKPGDAIFVPKETRYSLKAGDSGAEFVRVGFGWDAG